MRGQLLLLLSLPFAAGAAQAQGSRRAVVSQVAGATVYLSAGSDAGIRTGDTLEVRRAEAGPALGRFEILSATPSRSVASFVGPGFPVTRGDSLVLHVAAEGAAPAAGPVAPPPVVAAARRRGPGSRQSGGIGFDVIASRAQTVGLGADPLKVTRDYVVPSVRLRWGFDNPASGTGLNLSMVATHRAGTQGLFDRQTAIRIHEARLDQNLGGAGRISMGRFLSTFDRSSGYWDGAMLRIGSEHGLSFGGAAGFEPERVNETFTADAPKYAAFVNLRSGSAGRRYRADLAFHQMLPHGLAPRRSVIDWAQRLDLGPLHLSQDIEGGPDPLTRKWNVHRFQLRGSASVGAGSELHASVVSDHPPAPDSTLVFDGPRRERIGAGFMHRGARFFANGDVSVDAPRTAPLRGYTAALSFGMNEIAPSLGVSVAGSYFSLPGARGVVGGPSVEYALAGMRARVGYQFLWTQGLTYTALSHGGDVMLTRRLSSRIDWMLRVSGRYGTNERTAAVYLSLDARF